MIIVLKKKSFLIISAAVLLGLLLSACSTDAPNGKTNYDHVVMLEETNPYYIVGFADYVFIGSPLSDGGPVTLPRGNKRLAYDISVVHRLCDKRNKRRQRTFYQFV